MRHDQYPPRPEPLRPAMLDLVSRAEAARGEAGLFPEESNLLAALQEIVTQGQRPAERLLGAYHSDMRGMLAGIFAKYAD